MAKINSAATKQHKVFSRTVMVSLFAAFICSGSFINIPLPGGVPVVVQDMFALLSGILLGPLCGALSVLLFLFLGCVGLPVFSGKSGWLIIVNGPTGGFLVGYLVGAFVGGMIMKVAASFLPQKRVALSIAWASVSLLVANAVVFVLGILNFMRVVDCGITKALVICLVPFLTGTFLKFLVSIPLVVKFRPVVQSYLR